MQARLRSCPNTATSCCWAAKVVLVLLAISGGASAQQSNIRAGQTVTAWKGFAITGEISYAIATRSGSGKVEYWWIVKPWGYTTSTKTLAAPRGRLEIPWYGLWHELRVRSAEDASIDVRDSGEVRTLPTIKF